jgi:hypothetical protein
MTHNLKTAPEYFNSILRGLKSFEVRKDDREPKFTPNDKLVLEEYISGSQPYYTGRKIFADVLIVLRGEYCRDGYCIMSIVPTGASECALTNLTPAEITAMQQENTELKDNIAIHQQEIGKILAENAKLKAEKLKKLKYINYETLKCPVCNFIVADRTCKGLCCKKFCDNCGQALKRE